MPAFKPAKLNSTSDLRSALDENLPSVLSELGYDQSFVFGDTKLALGYSTVVVSASLFLLDKKFNFKEMYYVTIGLIALYFILSAILYYFLNAPKYKNNRYIGYNESKEKLSISSSTEKYNPIYKITLTLNDDIKRSVSDEIEFTKIFDSIGLLRREELKEFLKESLESLNKKKI